jgi:HSP20 family protein
MMERYRPHRRSAMVWSPFREMEEMERMMDEMMNRPMMRRRSPEEEYIWAPAIEMYEKDNNYIIRMELPGVRPEDVDISMSGETLTVKGERKPPEDIQNEEYQLCEVCYGNFTRTITLPESVDADKIEANFENGVLDLRIPKAEEMKPKQIKVQSKSSQTQVSQSPGNQNQGNQTQGNQSMSGAGGSQASLESIADSGHGVSESEQRAKSKIPYEG